MPVTKAILIHGKDGSPEENWFPWLRSELEKSGLHVFAPQFPIGDKQSLSNWMSEFKRWENAADEEAIMVGHSVGSAFILDFLERTQNTIAAAFLVAPFTGKLNNPRLDTVNKTLAEHDFNWDKIKHRCPAFFIYSSDNDPYVPLEKSEFLSNKLNSKFKIVHGAGHFSSTSNYARFDLLLEDIKTLAKASASPSL